MHQFLQWFEGGLANASVAAVIVFTLVVTHITIVSVTVYLHRHSAHRALDLHPVLSHFFRFWLWLTTGMVTREWTAIHRKHHATCETEDDPHSPVVMGLSTIFWRGVEAYRDAAVPETVERFGAGCPDDWLERNVYARHPGSGIFVMLAINLVLFGPIGLTVWAVQMVWIPLFAAGVINGIGHYWGYRNFECPDAARNISPIGLLIGGEELHNNHHTYPNSAKLSAKWWEFDVGWMWIRLFSLFGLAKVRSTGPVVTQMEGKSTLDLDTAWALVNDRFRVMARYAEDVMKPVLREERSAADASLRKLLRQAKKPMLRDRSIVSEAQSARLREALEHSEPLSVVYELREKLQQVWQQRTNGEALLTALTAWCKAAEESGEQALRDFARELRTYTVPRPALA